jgi:hypothetical protein
MPLVAVTMRDNIISTLNAITPQKFNISATATPETYGLIDAACTTFLPVYSTGIAGDMTPGLGPPPPPPGPPVSYPHTHTFLGASTATNITIYSAAFNTALAAFFVPPTRQASFALCWATGIISAIDSIQTVSDIQQGEAVHMHTWITVPTATPVENSVATCMVASWPYPPFDPDNAYSTFRALINAFATEFIRAVQTDTTWIVATGAGHFHGLS